MPRATSNAADFAAVFAQLKRVLEPYAAGPRVDADTSDDYYLSAPPSDASRKEMFFGAATIKRNYVSYHLMPVYTDPSLLDDVSSRLKRRMQGKSCFNFTTLDDELTAELTELTRRGFESCRAAGLT